MPPSARNLDPDDSGGETPSPAHPTDPHYDHALPTGPVRGRAANLNLANRFDRVTLSVLGEFLDDQAAEYPDGRQVPTTVYADATRSIINRVDSPDLGFHWTLNPYRGCEHGCIYCYARPTHETLGLSCGLDFETKIAAKQDAATLLAEALDRPSWQGETIMMSGVTDPYQPIERRLRITRACLEVLADRRQPVSVVTKNAMILRDIDLLAEMARDHAATAAISITTLDPDLARKMEPRASAPRDRLNAVRELSAAGIPVAVMTAPIIPGLNDHEIPRLLEAAKEAGATGAGWIVLRLPYQIKALFLEWLKREFPERASRVESAIRDTRGGSLYQSDWRVRQRGTGERADQIAATFKVFARRLGLDQRRGSLSPEAFLRRRAERERARIGPTLFDSIG